MLNMEWPPTLHDVETENELVPDLLYNLLAWIVSSRAEFSKDRVTNLPPEVNRLVLSVAQDMIHCVSRGRVTTPEHVVLPMTVKSLTGNAEVVTLLSYTQIEELELQQLLKSRSSNKEKEFYSQVYVFQMCRPYSAGITMISRRKLCRVLCN